MPDEKPIINISNDHDLLIRIDTRITDMLRDSRDFKLSISNLESEKSDKEEFEKRCKIVDLRLKDNDERIRKLERIAYIAIGIMSIVQVLITIFLK